MAIRRNAGTTALDRLRSRLEADLRCPECGYEDAEGEWSARTTGDRVLYRHVCPSCGAIDSLTLRLD